MKTLIGDNFGEVKKYKLYRNVYEIIHPTISKKNISNYKVVFDDKLLPVLVFYPKKVSNINSAIIYIVGDGNVSGSYGKYEEICKRVARESDRLVIAIDYFGEKGKYPSVVNKVFKVVKYLYDELGENNISSDKITLMGDSTGCKILGSVVLKLLSRKIDVNKIMMFYPVVRDSYNEYEWNEACLSVNFNLDKKIEGYLNRNIPKKDDYSCDLMEMIYTKNFPKTLIATGDMDILRDDGHLLAEKLLMNNEENRYLNIKFASHGFLSCNDEEITMKAFKEISDFVM